MSQNSGGRLGRGVSGRLRFKAFTTRFYCERRKDAIPQKVNKAHVKQIYYKKYTQFNGSGRSFGVNFEQTGDVLKPRCGKFAERENESLFVHRVMRRIKIHVFTFEQVWLIWKWDANGRSVSRHKIIKLTLELRQKSQRSSCRCWEKKKWTGEKTK